MINRVPLHFIQTGDTPFHCMPLVDIYVLEGKYTAMLDTGASNSFVSENFVKRHQGLKKLVTKLDKINVLSTGGGFDVIEDVFIPAQMMLANKKVKDLTVECLVIPNKAFADREYQMILGMDFFIKNNCVINLHDFFLAYL